MLDMHTKWLPLCNSTLKKTSIYFNNFYNQVLLYFQHFCGEAHKVWGMMNDLNNKQIQTVHDGYLKRFQLDSEAEFTFERIYRPDVIMIDEAQDVTPGTSNTELTNCMCVCGGGGGVCR